jgi:hypothetical protein
MVNIEDIFYVYKKQDNFYNLIFDLIYLDSNKIIKSDILNDDQLNEFNKYMKSYKIDIKFDSSNSYFHENNDIKIKFKYYFSEYLIKDKLTGGASVIPQTPLIKPSLDKPSLDKPSLDKPSLDKPSLDKPSLDYNSIYDILQFNDSELENMDIDSNIIKNKSKLLDFLDKNDIEQFNKLINIIPKNTYNKFMDQVQRYNKLITEDRNQFMEKTLLLENYKSSDYYILDITIYHKSEIINNSYELDSEEDCIYLSRCLMYIYNYIVSFNN